MPISYFKQRPCFGGNAVLLANNIKSLKLKRFYKAISSRNGVKACFSKLMLNQYVLHYICLAFLDQINTMITGGMHQGLFDEEERENIIFQVLSLASKCAHTLARWAHSDSACKKKKSFHTFFAWNSISTNLSFVGIPFSQHNSEII